MLPKDHLISHFRMSGSRWVIIPSWLSGSWSLFHIVLQCILATSSYYFLLLLDPYHFCPLLCPSLQEMFPWYHFLEEISSLSDSVAFLYFFTLITEEGFLISPCYSLELCIQMLISFLFAFAFRFFSFHIHVKLPQTAILLFCISFPWGWSWSLSPVECHKPPSIVHQALYLWNLVP